jgi:hypothetical protein
MVPAELSRVTPALHVFENVLAGCRAPVNAQAMLVRLPTHSIGRCVDHVRENLFPIPISSGFTTCFDQRVIMKEQDGLSDEGVRTDRRTFLKGAVVAGSALAAGTVGFPNLVKGQNAITQPQQVLLSDNSSGPTKATHWYIPATDKTVHWEYFSKSLKPIVEVDSGDFITVECLTHQAGDDPERMIVGDPGAKSVYYWTKEQRNVNRRGGFPLTLR